MKAKRFDGATYFRGEINGTYARCFADARLDCLEWPAWTSTSTRLRSCRAAWLPLRQAFLANRTAQAIDLLGPGWRTIGIIEPHEQDLGVPVIQAVAAQCWDIQRRVNVRQPVQGFGRLVADLP